MVEARTTPDLAGLVALYVRASEADAGTLLEQILEQCEKIVIPIVRSKLGSSGTTSQDVADVASETFLHLMERLEIWRSQPQEKPAENFAGYVAVSTYRACADYFRYRAPQRHRLKTSMRAILRTDERFAVWESEQGESCCGLREWMGRAVSISTQCPPIEARTPLREALLSYFEKAQGPVMLDELVDQFAHAMGLKDSPPAELREDSALVIPAGNPLEFRSLLDRAWQELLALPLPQRMALLLNLRDETGRSAIMIFPIAGIATLRQIASALEMPAEEFAGLVKDLPFHDLEIARRLGVTRQQVINYRKSARRRLERKLSDIR